MDLRKIISELQDRHHKLEAIIKEVEELNGPSKDSAAPFLRLRRGRKSMGEAERREVSARMKRYWASQRQASG